MVAETRSEYPSELAAITAVASTFDIRNPETLRSWVRQKCSDKRCRRAKSPRKNCTCKCSGDFHGSARYGSDGKKVTTVAQPVSPPRTKTLRTSIAVTVAVAVTFTIGALAFNGSYSGSATGGGDFSIQVKIDLNKILGALATILGFHSLRSPDSHAAGPSYHSDCAKNATGEVQQFLALHHCKQFATATRTVVKAATTAHIAISWVEMPTSTIAGKYKARVDAPNTGNPPGVSLAFNGFCYASGQQGATVWTVLVQPTGNVSVDRELLQAAAQEKLTPSYLRQHCIT